MRMELTARGVTSFFGGNRTSQPKLRIGTEISRLLSTRNLAEIDVLVPVRNAQRNSIVQFALCRSFSIRVHHPDNLQF